jgi:Ca-activated chloride channel family protein
MMFSFEWPWMAALFILPILVYFIGPRKTPVAEPLRTPKIRFPHLGEVEAAYTGALAKKSRPKKLWLTLLSLAWICLVTALMRPQLIDHIVDSKNKGHDLMLAVDLSASMQSLDFATRENPINRLGVAKKVVGDFLKKRAGDRVGLILFGEHAYLNAPLTLDTASVGRMLNNSLSGMAGDATAIGDALGLAVKNLRDRPTSSRAIILLTDGEDNASSIPPLQAATIAKQYGIHIYTVVIGKEGEVPFPDGQGGIAMVNSSVDTELTRKIAELTGGEFYTATDIEGLQKIYDRIDALEKSTVETQNIMIRTSLFQYPLGAGLTLLILICFASFVRKDGYELQPV